MDQATAEGVVKFGPGKLCRFCDLGLWIKHPSCGFYHEHHKTYSDLEASASGCALCALFVQEIQRKGYEFKDRNEPSSYISIRSAISKVPWSSRGPRDLLTVLVGENAKIDLELFNERGKYKSSSCLRLIVQASVERKVNLAGTEDNEAVGIFRSLSGRPVASNAADESCFNLARSWLNDCISNHVTCAKNQASALPTRLIYIEESPEDGQPRLRLMETHGERGQFVFMSHAWGAPSPPITTMANYEMRMKGIPIEHMPPSWRDAIVVLQRLRINYLWIDAVCILQDSEVDWEIEAASISHYIADATMVLAAGSGTASRSGLFTSRPTENLEVFPYTEQGWNFQSTGSLQIRRPLTEAREAILKTNLQKSAWTMQQTVLPERLLYYGDEQLYWNCQTCVLSEASSSQEGPIWKLASQLRAIINDPRAISSPLLLNIWYGLVEEYSTKFLVRFGDRLPAFETIARTFVTNDDIYLAGLWRRDLHRALLWVGTLPMKEEYKREYIAPSWSWASFQGPVQYELAKGIRLPVNDSSATIVDVEVQTKQALGFPQVVSGYIKLEALSLEIRAGLKIASCSYLFDTKTAEDSWESGQAYTGVLIARWCLGWTSVDSRWVGLILAEDKDEMNRNLDGSPEASLNGGIPSPQPGISSTPRPATVRKYKRVGLLNGPIYKEEMFGWETREFTII